MKNYVAMCGDHNIGGCENKTEKKHNSLREAVNWLTAHIEKERQNGFGRHHGDTRAKVVKLIDNRTAKIVAQHNYQGPGEEYPEIEEKRDGEELRRTPPGQDHVDDIVERGDLVKTSYGTQGKVYKVHRHEKFGLPIYTIIYVPEGAEPNEDGSYPENQLRWLNNLVAQDGEIKKLCKSNNDKIRKAGKAKKRRPRLSQFA